MTRLKLADLQEHLQPRLDVVREELGRIIAADFPLIAEVNSHLLQMHGKLFRPTMALLADEATGGPTQRAVRLAAVVELIHVATLVHDDIVDDAEMRRGHAAANHVWGNKLAVLLGDYSYIRSMAMSVGLGSERLERVLSPCHQRQPRPFTSQTECEQTPNATRRAGDQS